MSQSGLKFKPVLDNLVDKVWENKPKAPSANVFVHPVKYAGEVRVHAYLLINTSVLKFLIRATPANSEKFASI